jgi:hypothetical protein
MTGEIVKVRMNLKTKIYLMLLVFFVVVSVGFTVYRIHLKHKLRSKIGSLRAAGYPVTWNELDQFYSLPDDAENAAYIILNAIGYYNEPNDFDRIPVIVKANIPARGERLPDDVLKLIFTNISENKQSLDELHKISFLEHSRYPIDLSLGVNTRLDHFTGVQKCFILLQCEALYAAENEDPNQALNSIESIFGIARSFEAEPLYISQIVRLNYESMAVSTLEYVIRRMNFNNEQLIELERLLKEAEDSSGIKRAFTSERYIRLRLCENPAVFPIDILEGNVPAQPVLEVYQWLGLLDRAALVYLRFDKEFTNAFELPLHKQIEAFRAIEEEFNKSGLPDFLRLKVSSFSELVSLNVKTIAQLRIARVALSVQRYRLKNGKLPESLNNLVPYYVESIPLDPFDGQHIRYKKLDSGYVMYSIGDDKIDDGGKERSQESKKSGSTSDITFTVEKTD